MINVEVIDKLISLNSEDKYILDLILNELEAFEEYHQEIYAMETKMRIYTSKVMEVEDYQEMVINLDKKRTMKHNHVLTAVNVLNRLAAQNRLSPVYDGIISEDRPYRREVANAVLKYVEDVIKNRK